MLIPSAHYADYFKQTDSIDEPEFGFDWGELKKMHKSFLDSIIIELCLPNPPTPKHILFQILHEAVAEAPKEAKRFPQPLWDAVGDFAVGYRGFHPFELFNDDPQDHSTFAGHPRRSTSGT